jgi:TonB family protein
LHFDCRVDPDWAPMSSTIPAHVHIIAIALLSSWQPSFAQPTPDQIAKAKALTIYAPRPAYPYEARSKHLTGSGIVLLNIDPSSGSVTSAQLLKSTGHKILDDSALEAFRQWRFKPGSVRKVRIPINFTMQGFREYVRTKGHSLWLHNATYWFLPEYPRQARDKGLTGKGVAVVKIDPRTGYVTTVSMLKSTGQEILDNAALRAFRRWRFKARSITTLEIPIQFTTKGVFY